MTTDRQRAANRRNARRSTGPRTAVGKAVARRNAERHGLSAKLGSPLGDDPRVEALARIIAGDAPQPGDVEYARIAASATLQIARIRALRASLLELAARRREVYPRRNVYWTMKYEPPKPWFMMRNAAQMEVARQFDAEMTIEEKVERYTTIKRTPPVPPGEKAEEVLLPRMLSEALKLDRYERRELSRRKTADRRLEELRNVRLREGMAP